MQLNLQGVEDVDAKSLQKPLIVATRLTKIYNSRRSRRRFASRSKDSSPGFKAVDGVSFTVNPGEIFMIMGLSGSGKSTLIRMLNRLIDITDGSVVVNGENVGELSPQQLRRYRNETMNMVFQHFGLFPHKTLLDNVAFGLKVRGVSEPDRIRRATEALGTVGLGERLFALPEQLSGGQRQRVGLARALATDSKIVLMDEPFSALDPLIRKEMQELLVQLQKKLDKTIIFVTHDVNEALYLGDQILVMKEGRMEQLGKPIDLLESPANDYIREFVADADRSRAITARMIAGRGTSHQTQPVQDIARQRVEPSATIQEFLPLLAAGSGELDVVRAADGKHYGTITLSEAIAALTPKESAL